MFKRKNPLPLSPALLRREVVYRLFVQTGDRSWFTREDEIKVTSAGESTSVAFAEEEVEILNIELIEDLDYISKKYLEPMVIKHLIKHTDPALLACMSA